MPSKMTWQFKARETWTLDFEDYEMYFIVLKNQRLEKD